MHTISSIRYRLPRLAVAVAAAAALSVLSACGGGGPASVGPARHTGPATGGAQSPPTTSPTSSVPTPAPPPPVSGNDPHGVACSALSVAEIERATSLPVLRVTSGKNPARAGDSTCAWHLAPTTRASRAP